MDLINQIKDTLIARWEQFQESPVYAQMKERYDSLSPIGQKSFLWAALLLFVAILYTIPNAFLSSANDAIEIYEEKKQQAQELLAVTQASKSLPPLPQRLDSTQLKNAINSRLQEAGLTPEQIKGVNERTMAPAANALIPSSVLQNVVDVDLAQLNLKQMVDIEFQLTKINPLVKVVAADVSAHPSDNHYYDVRWSVASFNVKETEKADAEAKGGALKGRPAAKKPSPKAKSTEEETE